jgi:hypothetical protein
MINFFYAHYLQLLALVTGVLLEKQVVILCPNLVGFSKIVLINDHCLSICINLDCFREPFILAIFDTMQGVLSAVVLSLIPMIRPFQWQSLLLPVSWWIQKALVADFPRDFTA